MTGFQRICVGKTFGSGDKGILAIDLMFCRKNNILTCTTISRSVQNLTADVNDGTLYICKNPELLCV